jgi:hypothetical protein
MIKKVTIIIIIITVIAYAGIYKSTNNVFCFSYGSPGGYSGSPGDNHRDCTSCHGGTSSVVTGWITTSIPITGYIADSSYTISCTATASTEIKNFEATAESSSNAKVGTYTAGTGTLLVNSNKAVTTNASTSTNPITWTFKWKAPVTGTGTVTFYAAFALNEPITKTCSLSVNEFTIGIPSSPVENNFINFFPNPAKDQLIVDAGDVNNLKFSIYNITGQLQIEQTAFEKINLINISNLAKGIYLLKAESTKGIIFRRFVKD